MNTETEQKPERDTITQELNDSIRLDSTTEEGDLIIGFKKFNPNVNKGVYLLSENKQNVSQQVLISQANDGSIQETEVFVKKISNQQSALTERITYNLCKQNNVPSLTLLGSINTSNGCFNITKTENYLVPYSRLKISSLEQYLEMKSQGLNIIRLLNDIGIQHRDALTRNIATFTNSPRKSIIFDFETAFISHQTLNEKQRQQDEELFLQSLFFQLLSQNQGNKELIEKAKKISSL